jgi:hypothetical protein
MIKHALAVALLGIGIGFTGHAPVRAAPLPSGIAASSIRMADDTVVKVGCLDEVPVVANVVAFFELLSDEEYKCHRHFDGDDYDRRTYDERKYPAYKDGGYAEPKDLKGPR